MRLERIEVIPYSLAFREPYTTARGRLSERQLLLVRVRADGLEGLGETAALSLRGGSSLAEIAREIETGCRPALLEGELEPDRIWAALARCRNRGAGPEALAAIDIALHDLAAQAAGQPLWRYLGAETARPVRCNATLPMANPSELRTLLERWADEGFTSFKLKVGGAGDAAQVATARAILGAEARIRLDANGAWSLEQATERLAALAEHGIELVEEPVSGLAPMAQLAERTSLRLAADESVASAREAREAISLGACQLATVKLAKVGGIAAAQQIAEEISIYLSSALEGPVGIAAAAQLAQLLPAGGPAHGLATERLFSTPVGAGPELSGDRLIVDELPGLGVELDEDALRARQLP